MDRWWRKRSSAGWRALVQVEAQDLEDELERANPGRGPDLTIATEGLKDARDAAKPSPSGYEQALDWWSGARIERAWGALHRVQGALLMLGGEEWLRAQIPRIERALLGADDTVPEEFKTWLEALRDPKTAIDPARQELRAMRRFASVASDQKHREIRALRNLLTAVAVLLTLFLLLIGFIQLAWPDFIPLCASPGSFTGANAGDLCVSGGPSPAHGDLFQVELIGAAAGLLAGVFALWKMTRLPEPYGLPTAQILLKAPAGGMTAIIGVLMLQAGALLGLSPQPGSQMLAYAALFGFSQQLLTGLVDRRASTLLAS